MKGYLNYLVIKVMFLVLEPRARVTYDRKADFIRAET